MAKRLHNSDPPVRKGASRERSGAVASLIDTPSVCRCSGGAVCVGELGDRLTPCWRFERVATWGHGTLHSRDHSQHLRVPGLMPREAPIVHGTASTKQWHTVRSYPSMGARVPQPRWQAHPMCATAPQEQCGWGNSEIP